MKITNNFSLYEFTDSPTAKKLGINNLPGNEEIKNIILLTVNLLQPARDEFGKVIKINSGYRCPELNREIGGSKTSQHLKGQAADLNSEDNAKLWDILSKLDFTQLIWYYDDSKKNGKPCPDFIHVGYNKDNLKKQRLYCYLEKNDNGIYIRKYRNFE